MNTQARTFHEDHLKRKVQSLQLAYTRALNSHDGSAPLYLHQEMDFLGHFELDAQVSLAMVPEIMQQDPVAGVMLMTSQLNTQQTSALATAVEKGTLNAALLAQLFGATNLPGNLANLIEAAAKARFTSKMKTELRATLASGKSRTVKLGKGVELKTLGLKGPNQFGKHADVLIRVRQTNAKQITLLEKNQFQQISKNMSTKSLGPNAFKYDKVLSLSRQASDEMWELRRLTGAPWLSSIKVGAVLGLAPTLISDIMNNYNHHATLGQRFNWQQFGVDTATNQTGNLLAMGGGAMVATLAIAGGLAGAPLVIVALGAGLLIGALYQATDADDWVKNKAKILFN
ncbi:MULTISPECIES: hypothetical protein [unclassified Limnobacter]|jgi:hypothetical protein|uniref:hypothetical protein n=1 Tax=unclassified Limnobacter TaxID=2630203 RepID=UPI000C5D014E|nr:MULTISPECIES: hypothetical protein [unclassified Limnobacter]MAZ08906.1 hypothetical protein [Sutterellaceae bacterium]|tara:strand:+ start:13191 stop:14219 length:1029 start_codon:yes stop_codon:yes gene_type:complete